MNKYEKAIDAVARYCSDYRAGIFPPRNEVYKELDILNELVEIATPKKAKPLFINLPFMPYRCPCCGHLVNDGKERFNYCPNCGQKIDWFNVKNNEEEG